MQQQQVVNFLNEVASQFPRAISLAAGRPSPMFFAPQQWPHYQQQFVEYCAKRDGVSEQEVYTRLCEYGPSGGIINDIVARYLTNDESIEAQQNELLTTNGFQEAAALYCLARLNNGQPKSTGQEVIVTLDPSYIGLSAMVETLGKKVIGISIDKLASKDDFSDLDWHGLRTEFERINGEGYKVKAFYINPDFNNPLSFSLNVEQRLGLLALCDQFDIEIIEDATYSRFDYRSIAKGGSQYPALYQLDTQQRVFYCGSFAKLFCPGVRVGFLLVPKGLQQVREQLVALKSLLTVNTSGLSQAVIGGWLLANDCRLGNYLQPILTQYQKQREAMAAALEQHLGAIEGVSFYVPHGGFFAQVKLPFALTTEDVFACASEYGVICMPVSFFSLAPSTWQNRIRLSFSYYQEPQIFTGIEQFARFVCARLSQLSLTQSNKYAVE